MFGIFKRTPTGMPPHIYIYIYIYNYIVFVAGALKKKKKQDPHGTWWFVDSLVWNPGSTWHASGRPLFLTLCLDSGGFSMLSQGSEWETSPVVKHLFGGPLSGF